MIRRIVLLLASSALALLVVGGVARVFFPTATPVSSVTALGGGVSATVLLWVVCGACLLQASVASRAVLLSRRGAGGRDVVRPVGLTGSFAATSRPGDGAPVAPPARHGVYFYDSDDEIVSAVADAFAPAMEAGGVILLVATPDHVEAVETELRRRGLSPDPRSYLAFDASETLRSVMVRGLPDRARFEAVVGTLVEELSFRGPLCVYGEMVNLLWERGQVGAALRLESFWNDLATRFEYSLLCGYRALESDDTSVIDDICDSHSHLVGSLH